VKIVVKDILPFQEQHFFFAIRNKIDYARLLVYGARQLLLAIETGETKVYSNMKLIVDKMSRLFFYKNKKYFSVSFPFITTLDNENNVIELTTYTGKRLDHQSISAVISIIDSEEFKLNPSLIDFYIEPNGIESSGVLLLEEIFQFEPSYIRYDSDPDNEKGKLHPLNHLDINYSQYSTFKLGLPKEITFDYFENLQNIKTDCSFVID
jgi:hypothetical protein